MPKKTYTVGIIGCGDYLRLQAPELKSSGRVLTKLLFDPATERSQKWAAELGGSAVASAEAIFDDSGIDIVAIFTPPWVRKDLVLKAVAARKIIITTKPLAASSEDAAEIVRAVEASGLPSVVGYRRTGSAVIETMKRIFDAGEVGRLMLYKQDWMHHFPAWNPWATDPVKNGGPFMDAMIHNLNTCRYLMGRPATHFTYFSDNFAHPSWTCNDTEFMKLDFTGGGAAHLFITWAADLAVYSTKGNDRERIYTWNMVTDQGWRVYESTADGKPVVMASREGQTRTWIPAPIERSSFDRFIETMEAGTPVPSDMASLRDAYADIRIIRDAARNIGQRTAIDLNI